MVFCKRKTLVRVVEIMNLWGNNQVSQKDIAFDYVVNLQPAPLPIRINTDMHLVVWQSFSMKGIENNRSNLWESRVTHALSVHTFQIFTMAKLMKSEGLLTSILSKHSMPHLILLQRHCRREVIEFFLP